MEKILYKQIYNKISKLKTTSTLGAFATFLHKEIIKEHSELTYDIISDRTLERGFRTYLDSETLQTFNIEKKEEDKRYEASLQTLNLLAKYMGYKDYAGFSYETLKKQENNTNENTEENSPKISFTVNQFGKENINVGEIKTDNLYL